MEFAELNCTVPLPALFVWDGQITGKFVFFVLF
jgi:hypothetical protein